MTAGCGGGFETWSNRPGAHWFLLFLFGGIAAVVLPMAWLVHHHRLKSWDLRKRSSAPARFFSVMIVSLPVVVFAVVLLYVLGSVDIAPEQKELNIMAIVSGYLITALASVLGMFVAHSRGMNLK